MMKLAASGLLLVTAAVYAATFHFSHGATGVPGAVRAAAEAGMVGGMADWFAVTALFRRPLGLPIPHTALIPTRKDELGRTLQGFVGSNFLAEDVVRAQLSAAHLPERLGAWLAAPEHAAQLADELAESAAAMTRALDGDALADIADTVLRAASQRLPLELAGPALGRLLSDVVGSGAHRAPAARLFARLGSWLDEEDALKGVLLAVGFSRDRFLGNRAINVVETVLRRRLHALASTSSATDWDEVDATLRRLATALKDDPTVVAAMHDLLAAVLEAPELRQLVRGGTASARGLLADLLDEHGGELRSGLAEAVSSAGRRLLDDDALRRRIDERLAVVVTHGVTTYRQELTAVISATVDRWDGPETARRVELLAGRDLQFVRVNGTVVGALVGLVIHGLTVVS